MTPVFASLRFVCQFAKDLNDLCSDSLFERIMSARMGKNAAYDARSRIITFCAVRPIFPSCVMSSRSFKAGLTQFRVSLSRDSTTSMEPGGISPFSARLKCATARFMCSKSVRSSFVASSTCT